MCLLSPYAYMYVLCMCVCTHMHTCTHTHVYGARLQELPGLPCIALVGTIVKPISAPVSRWRYAEGRLPVAFSDSGHITNRVSMSLDEP